MMNDILIKGQDGKWYVLRGEELVPYGEELSADSRQPTARVELPISRSVSHEGHPLAKELEEIVDRVVAQSGVSLTDSVLQKRFRMLVSSRLRDVRDMLEARAILTRDQKVGGIGLREDERAKVEEQMEKAVSEFQTKWKTVEEKRRQEWVRAQQEQRAQREQREQLTEEHGLEERYARLTGGIPKFQTSITKEIPKPKVQIPKTQEPPKVKLALPPPPPAVVKLDTKATTAPKVPTVPPHPALSPRERGWGEGGRQPSAVIRQPSRITDIRSAPKLVGPIEELQSITLADFRKLSASPTDAILKIEAKINRLRLESLTRGSQGIGAWRSSPLHHLYNQIMNESLAKRVSPEEIISQKGNMTADEFNAIMELNQKLRF